MISWKTMKKMLRILWRRIRIRIELRWRIRMMKKRIRRHKSASTAAYAPIRRFYTITNTTLEWSTTVRTVTVLTKYLVNLLPNNIYSTRSPQDTLRTWWWARTQQYSHMARLVQVRHILCLVTWSNSKSMVLYRVHCNYWYRFRE